MHAFKSTLDTMLPFPYSNDLLGDLSLPGESSLLPYYTGAVVLGAGLGSFDQVPNGPDYSPLVWQPGQGYTQGESSNEQDEDNYYATHKP
jgi:hypothetical protein